MLPGLCWMKSKINAQTQELFQSMHLQLDPRTKAADLTVAKQQMVEIAKALSFNSQVLIMDEPTAALTETEIEELFRIIRHLRAEGCGHRLYFPPPRRAQAHFGPHHRHARRSLCRHGGRRSNAHRADHQHDGWAHDLRSRTGTAGRRRARRSCWKCASLNRGAELIDINFQLTKGEILGFAGLMGAGRTEVARAIFGADPIDSGEICVNGELVKINSPQDAVRHGIGYLSEDRKRYGLALGMDVEANIVLASYQDFLGALGIVKDAKAADVAEHYVDALSIKTPSIEQTVKNLSGGNQQKVVIGKWLTADSDILIFDEPTRGIDVGAKSEIYRLLNDLGATGQVDHHDLI